MRYDLHGVLTSTALGAPDWRGVANQRASDSAKQNDVRMRYAQRCFQANIGVSRRKACPHVPCHRVSAALVVVLGEVPYTLLFDEWTNVTSTPDVGIVIFLGVHRGSTPSKLQTVELVELVAEGIFLASSRRPGRLQGPGKFRESEMVAMRRRRALELSWLVLEAASMFPGEEAVSSYSSLDRRLELSATRGTRTSTKGETTGLGSAMCARISSCPWRGSDTDRLPVPFGRACCVGMVSARSVFIVRPLSSLVPHCYPHLFAWQPLWLVRIALIALLAAR